jgi:hypothetical protein
LIAKGSMFPVLNSNLSPGPPTFSPMRASLRLFRLNGAGGYVEVFPEGAITLANARGFTQIATGSDWSNPKKGGRDPFQDLLNDFLAWIEGGQPPR